MSHFSLEDREKVWRSVRPRIATADSDANDLLHVLDQIRQEGIEVYLDDTHVTERANEIIAQAIFETLFPLL
jgi:hypothetical protein